MDYNELKIRLLSLFEASSELDSQRVRNLLSGMKIELSDKAVEMALLRYFRQGLLSRTRRSGGFTYGLIEEGVGRTIWLSKAKSSSVGAGGCRSESIEPPLRMGHSFSVLL